MRSVILITLFSFLISCTNDDDNDNDNLSINITVNDGSEDVDGDFTGNGGNGTRTINWVNNLSTADYNADITSTSSGLFQMKVTDNNGTIVLNRSLNGNVEPDSFSGVTNTGEPGTWSVIITLTSFNGDGSYSLSSGN